MWLKLRWMEPEVAVKLKGFIVDDLYLIILEEDTPDRCVQVVRYCILISVGTVLIEFIVDAGAGIRTKSSIAETAYDHKKKSREES